MVFSTLDSARSRTSFIKLSYWTTPNCQEPSPTTFLFKALYDQKKKKKKKTYVEKKASFLSIDWHVYYCQPYLIKQLPKKSRKHFRI